MAVQVVLMVLVPPVHATVKKEAKEDEKLTLATRQRQSALV